MLRIIGAFKIFKGILLLAVGVNAFRLIHADMAAQIDAWVLKVHADANNKVIHAIIGKLLQIDAKKLKFIGVGTFIYASLFLIEGTGLALGKRWGEIVTVISTGLLIPVEIYEIFEHRHPHNPYLFVTKIVVFVLNAMVLAYLLYRLRKDHGGPPPRS